MCADFRRPLLDASQSQKQKRPACFQWRIRIATDLLGMWNFSQRKRVPSGTCMIELRSVV
jgi:hypothetical protein